MPLTGWWYNEFMNKTTYHVTCLKCGGSNDAIVTTQGDDIIIDLNQHHRYHTPYIISARKRGDLEIGWECICGNDSRVCRQEASKIESLVVGSGKKAIDDIVKSLAVPDEKKFRVIWSHIHKSS